MTIRPPPCGSPTARPRHRPTAARRDPAVADRTRLRGHPLPRLDTAKHPRSVGHAWRAGGQPRQPNAPSGHLGQQVRLFIGQRVGHRHSGDGQLGHWLGRLSDMADAHPPVPGDLPDTSVFDRPQLSVSATVIRRGRHSPDRVRCPAVTWPRRWPCVATRCPNGPAFAGATAPTKTASSANSWSPPAEHSHRSPTSAAVTRTSKGTDSPFSLRVRVGTFFA